jgi:hypothetical protein
LVQLSGDEAWFQQQILDALASPRDDFDLENLFDFALIYAREGDRRARMLMYEQCARQIAAVDEAGAYQLIDLEGTEGFLFLASLIGERGESDSYLWDGYHLLVRLEETGATANLMELRAAAGRRYPFVGVYLDRVAAAAERKQAEAQARPQLRGQPYARIEQHIEASNGRFSFVQLKRWGQEAPDEELRQAVDDLLRQTEPQPLIAYLAIFRKRAFPQGFEPLLPLVRQPHERVARASIAAVPEWMRREAAYDANADTYLAVKDV